MKSLRLLVLIVAPVISVVHAQSQLPFDHVHFAVPDPAAAIAWYSKYMGAVATPDPPTHAMMGPVRLDFLKSADAQPSAGSSVDHIGISFSDLDAKMKQLAAAGTKVVTPARDVPGVFRAAVIEDPWGTKIELIQDTETLGFHQVHLRSPNPDETLAWYLDKFGGVRTKLKGRIDAVKYGTVWLLVQTGESVPSQGHSIDHIGWRADDVAATLPKLKAKGATVTSEPRSVTFLGEPIVFSFLQGPSGTRIEFIQR